MTNALFSEFMMPQEIRSPLGTEGKRASPDPAQLQAIVATTVQDLLRRGHVDLDPETVRALVASVAGIMAGRSVVLRLGDTVDDSQRASVQLFLNQVVRATGELAANRQEAAIEKLAEVILPDPLADARGALAVDNLALRDRFVAETHPLSSAEVAAAAGYKGVNRYSTAARWKKEQKIFSVNHRGVEYFPVFQFRDGRPHPTVKSALAALPEGLSAWQWAFWFVSTNGWLNDRAPADMLDDPDAVLAAARHEANEVFG